MGPRKLEERERVGQNSGCAYLACTFIIGVPPTREMHGLVVGGSKSEENARYPGNAEAKVGAAVCPPGHARILSGVHSTGEQGRSAEMNSTPRSSSGSRFVDQQSSRAQHRKRPATRILPTAVESSFSIWIRSRRRRRSWTSTSRNSITPLRAASLHLGRREEDEVESTDGMSFPRREEEVLEKKKKLLLLSTCTSTAVYLAGNTFSIYHVGGSVVYRVQARLYLSGR